MIEDGDQIFMKNAFIDTKADNTDRFAVEDPIKIDTTVGFYLENVHAEYQDNTVYQNDTYITDTTKDFVDGDTYVLCHRVDSGTPIPNAGRFNGFQIQYSVDRPPTFPAFPENYARDTFSNVTLQIAYKNVNTGQVEVFNWVLIQNDEIPYSLAITYNNGAPPQPNGPTANYTGFPTDNPLWSSLVYDKSVTSLEYGGKTYVGPLAFVGLQVDMSSGDQTNDSSLASDGSNASIAFNTQGAKETNFKWKYFFIDPTNPPAADGLRGTIVRRHVSSVASFTIPPGSYSADQLCLTVNEAIQKNTPQQPPPAGNENLALINSNYFAAYNPSQAEWTNTTWVNTNATNAFDTSASALANDGIGGILIGASQMVLSYDHEAEQFQWEYLHTPYYGPQNTADAVESAGLIRTGNVTAGSGVPALQTVRRNGGIFFTSFTQNRILANGDEEQTNFFGDVLKFDMSKLVVANQATQFNQFSNKGIGSITYTQLTVPKAEFVKQAGISTTTGYLGLDASIDRGDPQGSPPPGDWWLLPKVGADAGDASVSAITGLSTPILAAGQEQQADGINFGYFLIEVEAKFQQDFVGAEYISNSIRAVVSRYYNQNSYTVGSAGDSIPYVHRGLPMLLQSMRFRILQGNKTIAPNHRCGSLSS
jgi:hypothetical protein